VTSIPDALTGPTRESPVRYAPFRWLLAGSSINMLGSSIAPVALTFAVLDLGGSATDLGVVLGLFALADVAAIMFGGVLGDRLSRTVMMQGSSATAALFQGFAAASLVGGWSSIPLLAGIGMINGALGALGGPSSQAITPQTVPAGALPAAVAWRRLCRNVSQIVGAGAAGLLVVWVGTGWCFAIDAASFAVAALCYSRIWVPSSPAPAKATVFADMRAGAGEVFRHTWMWVLILQALLYHLFYGGAQGVLGPIVVADTISIPAWGWALSSMMAGFIAGGLVTLRWRPLRLLYVGTCLLALTALFPAAMAFSDSLLVVLAAAFAHGFGLEIFSVAWDLAIQQNVAPEKLARVYSFDMAGSFIARPLGLALTGPVAEIVGFRAWLAVVAAVIVASTATALIAPDVRRLERRA
jgi:MFS family permease